MRRIAGPPSTNQPTTRAINMSMGEAVKNKDVIVGMLPINSVNAKVLVDSGATILLFIMNLLLNYVV